MQSEGSNLDWFGWISANVPPNIAVSKLWCKSASHPALPSHFRPSPRPHEVIWPRKASLDSKIMNEVTKHVCHSALLTCAGEQGSTAAAVHWGWGFTHVASSLRRCDGLCVCLREITPHPPTTLRQQHLLMSHKRIDVMKVCWFEKANYLCIGCMLKNIHINFSDVMIKNRKEKQVRWGVLASSPF